jgi:hypothetical protein
MASARRADMAEPTDLEPMPAEQPKMVVTHGRGGTGKSTGVRILKERADEAGRPVAIADADRTNATLGSFYADVVRPEYRGEQGVTDWLDDLVNTQAETRMSLLLDMGGGDQVFKRFAASLDLAALLQAEGIVPVALHFFGPDIDDLGYLRDIEESGAFCPAQTVLVLNAGLIKDTRPVDVAFAGMREHPIYLAALKRGAKEIVLPRLACMQEEYSRRLSLHGAEKALGLTNRQRVAMWRREVAKALAPVADWLP